MVVDYAFRPPESFSSGMCSLKAYKQNLLTAILEIYGEIGATATPIFRVRRDSCPYRIFASEWRREVRLSLKWPECACLY